MNKKVIFISVVVLLVAAGAIWYFASPNNPAGMKQAYDVSGWKTYSSNMQGYQVQYPADWGIELNSILEDSVTFGDPSDASADVTIAVADVAAEQIVRDSLKIDSESQVSVGGLSGQKLIVSDSAGQNLVVYLVVSGSKLYYIAGRATQMEEMVSTMQFFEPTN